MSSVSCNGINLTQICICISMYMILDQRKRFEKLGSLLLVLYNILLCTPVQNRLYVIAIAILSICSYVSHTGTVNNLNILSVIFNHLEAPSFKFLISNTMTNFWPISHLKKNTKQRCGVKLCNFRPMFGNIYEILSHTWYITQHLYKRPWMSNEKVASAHANPCRLSVLAYTT